MHLIVEVCSLGGAYSPWIKWIKPVALDTPQECIKHDLDQWINWIKGSGPPGTALDPAPPPRPLIQLIR
jgi:hypothetical protein